MAFSFQDMFNEQEKADAMGVLHKIEFIKGILDLHRENPMSDNEFYALILIGGIDVGVTTLGTLKYKMESFRDENTMKDAQRALEMAHFYVLIAESRNMLHDEIKTYMKLTTDTAGLTEQFFTNTQTLGKVDYKYLFWWDDKCCTHKPKHAAALLAYNMPLKKHTGKDKAAGKIQAFLKRHRTDKYYNDKAMDMSDVYKLSIDTKTSGKYTVGKKFSSNDTDGEFENQYTTGKTFGGLSERKYHTPADGYKYYIECSGNDAGTYHQWVLDVGIGNGYSRGSGFLDYSWLISFTPKETERQPNEGMLVGRTNFGRGAKYFMTDKKAFKSQRKHLKTQYGKGYRKNKITETSKFEKDVDGWKSPYIWMCDNGYANFAQVTPDLHRNIRMLTRYLFSPISDYLKESEEIKFWDDSTSEDNITDMPSDGESKAQAFDVELIEKDEWKKILWKKK